MKIVICGNYGAGNLGDEMILEGILESIRKAVPGANITILSGNPEETAEKYKTDSTEKFPAGIRSYIKNIFQKNTIQNCDLFILGGGGLFGGPEKRANKIWKIQAEKAHNLGAQVLMLGQSIGKLTEDLQKKLKPIFEKSRLIAVRDKDSKIELQKIIKNEISVLPDFAFRKKTSQESKRKKEIIIALRQMPGLDQAFFQQITEFLKTKNDYKLIFIDFQKGEDSIVHQQIIKKLGSKAKVQHIEECKTEEALQLFSGASFVLGMRLHSMITAIKTCTPFIAINYALKVKNYLKTLNLEQYSLDIKNLDQLENKFTEVMKDKKLPSELNEYNQNALKQFEDFEKNILKPLIDPKNHQK